MNSTPEEETACLELCFTRRFCMGHRLVSDPSSPCALPHGHNEYVTVTLGPGPNSGHFRDARLDGRNNMLLPFAEAKGRWHRFIDTKIDHGLQLSATDPLLNWFRQNEPHHLNRLIITPGDPTTELMAALLLAKLNAFLKAQGEKLQALSLELKETPTNTVKLHGNPQTCLPLSGRPAQECWWNRADDSISDNL